MEARNAVGRRISLLNEVKNERAIRSTSMTCGHTSYAFGVQDNVPERFVSRSGLRPVRHYSDILQLSTDSTINIDFTDSSRIQTTDILSSYLQCLSDPKRSRSFSYEEGNSTTLPARRYPCRFRTSHGCQKTFTTSGHASRHSKVHTAEKPVQCTFVGYRKTFARTDNMKQHLKTHFKYNTRSPQLRLQPINFGKPTRPPSLVSQ